MSERAERVVDAELQRLIDNLRRAAYERGYFVGIRIPSIEREDREDAAEDDLQEYIAALRTQPAPVSESPGKLYWATDPSYPCPTCGAIATDSPRRLTELLAEVAASGIEHDDARMDYVTVQIDRDVWNRVRGYEPTP